MLTKPARRPDWQIALVMTVALRVFFSTFAAVASFFLHPDSALIQSNELTQNLPAPGTWYYVLLGVWERFDTLWYLRIASHGYDLPLSVIFYPLYPAAIHVLSLVMPAMAAALVVSTAATFFFFWGLLRLGEKDLSYLGELRMVLLVAVWPTSFILFAGYADSLTFALVVWAVVFGREGKWWSATALGILAGLSRPSGVLVAVPLFVLGLRSRRVQSLVVILAPLGTLGYWGWLHLSGRSSVVGAYGKYQHMMLVPPWQGLAKVLQLILSGHDALLAIKLALVILVVVLSLRRQIRLEDKLFALVVVMQILMYTGRPLLGAARYLMLAYPAFIALGSFAERRWTSRQFGFYFVGFGLLNLVWMWSFLEWSLLF